MNAIKINVFRKIQVGFLWATAICPLPADFWDGEVYKTNHPENIEPAGLDSYRREKLAELLAKSVPRKVYLELPETRAAQALSIEDLTEEENLGRARVLTQYNRHTAVLKTLAYVGLTCEVSYLKSLAYRRLRKYRQAQKSLKETMAICEGDFKRKAHFLNARIAAMSPSDTALEVLDNFLELYPNDHYTDDVLLWKAHVLKDLGRETGAILDQIIQEHPQGDMRDQALFERAFVFVSEGQLKSALELLARLNTEQGQYWHGRLMDNAEGKKILRELSEKNPASYYGYFAGRLAGLKSFPKPKKWVVPQSSLLQADPIYQSLLCFKKAKYLDEAVWIVDRLARKYRQESERFVLAQEYLDLNRPDKAHQLMRDAGLAFPRFNSDEPFYWDLAFSRAYSKEFLKAARKQKLPLDWITGLSREESRFDAQAISWAGAVGLCQLLPSTAHLPESELLNAETNIQRGAGHLKELSEEFMHPLKAIAAYNAGKGAVKRWVRQNPASIPMDYFVEQIPYEQTRNYVKKVSSAWLTYAWLGGRLQNNLYSIENDL